MKRALLGLFAVAFVLVATAPAAHAADQEAIDKSVGRGVAFLHDHGRQDQIAAAGYQPAGVNALVGLTLLECGAGADDAVVRRVAEMVRPASVSLHDTYSLALAVDFLDRLGDPTDAPLIGSMTVRLLAGQGPSGGWSYTCPEVNESEVRRLTAHLKQQVELIGRRERPNDQRDDKQTKRSAKDLSKAIQDQLALIGSTASPNEFQGDGDNSNTQFATLALWVGRRHGLPVEQALARLDRRFRTTQNADGGWAYTGGSGGNIGGSSASMTCAGLFGLAVAQGEIAETALEKGKTAPESGKDRVLKGGLAALGTTIGVPAGKRRAGAPLAAMPNVGGRSYYFFWSLERVAMALDLKTIGGKDWYGWGAEVLLANQSPDGSWQGEYPATVDTCFALLFLRRANLTRDLTARLKGKLQDPGEVTLKAGGVGGDALAGTPGLKSGLDPKDDRALIGLPRKGAVESRPPSSEDMEGARMARELFHAPAERRDQLLEKYRDGKGVTYTEALAGAIPQMSGQGKRMARDALAERLTRMKAETLTRYFQDQDAEIRRAAALAAAMKESKSLIPDLIGLLQDPEPAVAHAAHAALKDLSGEALGPSADEWKAWWKKRERK